MQYLPASAHAIFTCLCTQRWGRRGCWTSELSPEPGPSYSTHTHTHKGTQQSTTSTIWQSQVIVACVLVWPYIWLFSCVFLIFFSSVWKHFFLLFRYRHMFYLFFLFLFSCFFIADDNMRKQFSFLSVHTYKNPAGLSGVRVYNRIKISRWGGVEETASVLLLLPPLPAALLLLTLLLVLIIQQGLRMRKHIKGLLHMNFLF